MTHKLIELPGITASVDGKSLSVEQLLVSVGEMKYEFCDEAASQVFDVILTAILACGFKLSDADNEFLYAVLLSSFLRQYGVHNIIQDMADEWYDNEYKDDEEEKQPITTTKEEIVNKDNK